MQRGKKKKEKGFDLNINCVVDGLTVGRILPMCSCIALPVAILASACCFGSGDHLYRSKISQAAGTGGSFHFSNH